ncbi:O-antigen ligase [Croceicoccus sp. Ery5]|uniref:O-antigen ligase family protein n=1 Tax=Croceicoccus sp. Ery5 TaxID=1703340 RepID=UPI001E3B7974|nr:O-antigen ligase family protein [Croceicoccus sp. Ery5]
MLAGLGVVIAIQLVPLPPDIWTTLPGHARFAEAAVVTGLEQPWRPVSLVPWLTWNALFALLPALAILVGLWGTNPRQREKVIAGFLIFLGISILLGIAQVAGALNGPPLHYRFFAQDSAIGFFANRNHAAAVLATGFPVLRLWSLDAAPGGGSGSKRRIFALIAALVLLVMIVVTGSRTGMLIGFASLAASLAMAPIDELGKKLDPRKAWLIRLAVVAVPVLVVVLLILFGKAVALDRIVDDDLLAEQRVVYLPLLLDLMRNFLPFGSGFGTFDPVYRSFEPDWAITTKYLNHAHNDLLELMMTGGIPGLAVLGAFLLWIAARLWRTRKDSRRPETISVRAGAIMAAALLGASLTDYPLRTPIAGVVLVFACWLMARPLFDMKPPAENKGKGRSSSSAPSYFGSGGRR